MRHIKIPPFSDVVLKVFIALFITLIVAVGIIYIPLSLLWDEISGENYRDRKEERRRKRYPLDVGGVQLTSLPFECSLKDVIYTEGEYDEETNRCILENMDYIKQCFAKYGFRFVYLPLLAEEIQADRERVMAYYCPAGFADTEYDVASLNSNFLLDFMMKPENRPNVSKPSLMRYNEYASSIHGGKVFNVFPLNIKDAKDIHDYFDFFAEKINTERDRPFGLFCIRKREPEDADDAFDKETRKLLEFVAQKIDELRGMGVSETVLRGLLTPKPKLSRVVIKKDYTIVLPDYKDMIIKMEPLAKSVFLLFLRHHDGIRFKELPDYRDELARIYEEVKKRRHVTDKEFESVEYSRSIINVTDPLNNSINEKCTRIKEAFLMRFHESMAENYFITGKRGEPKRIKLPEELIVWEK